MGRFVRLLIFSAISFSLIAAPQTGSGSITGVIKDATGAPIAGATVKIANQQTGVAIETLTNESGTYRTTALNPGTYRLDVDAAGFEHLTRSGLTVEVGQTVAADLTLSIGAHSESLIVTEAAPLTDSQSSNVSQTVTRDMLAGLPLPNRAASSLAALAPGVVMIDSGAGTAENYPVFSVAGGRARNQTFILDGGNVSNAVGLTRPQQLTSLPVDAMQEFRVIANNYAAEYGHSTGGIVTMSTRAGTNQLHGSLFESLRNDVFDARNFFARSKPPIRLNQFGGALGGPVVKDRTHFFVTWEETRQLIGTATTATVPTLANRFGDFSASSALIYDIATTSGREGQLFPGNIIPASRFDPVARAALDYYPLPNQPGTASGANNFAGISDQTLSRNIVVARLDHQFRQNDQATARYYVNDSGTNTTGAYGHPIADPDADLTDVRVQSILLAETHVFRPSLVNDLRATYLRRKFIDTRPGNGAFPAYIIPGYATLGNPTSVARYQTPITDTQILDSLSWFRGKHALKFGAEFRRGANTETRDRGSSGIFAFSPLITSLPGVSGTGNALASFLLGEVNSASVQISDRIPSRAAYWSLYAQDDWRITDRLTVNLGLRWEVELPRRVVGNLMNSFDPLAMNPVSGTPGVVTFAGRDGVPERAFTTDWNNLGPRAGFAYRLPGAHETVIRGGAGVLYGPTVSNTVGDAAATGFSTAASFVTPQADLLSVFLLRDGLPAVSRPPLTPGYGAAAPGQKPFTAVSYFDPHQVAPISYQYNFNVQREVGRGVLLEIGYIGNVSHHLTGNDLSIDQVAPQLMGPGDSQARRPFPQFSNVSLINPSVGNSTYHAGYIRAEKRLSSGISFLAHYTWSKFLDDVEAANEFNGTPASYMDAYNRRLDKGLSGSDVPHRAVVSALFERRGWKLGVFQTLESGPPFTVVMAANTTNAFSAGPLRPNLLSAGVYAAPAPYTFGNAPRNGLRATPIFTTDATVEKSITVTEHSRAEVRAEVYNLLNRANLDIPGHTLGAADFGFVSSSRPARYFQLALRLGF
jgi:hypothetical protein